MSEIQAWQRAVASGVQSGLAATAATSLAAASRGWLESREPIGPLNAVSHIAWGPRATRQNELSVKYTLTGLCLHTAAVIGWAAIHERLTQLLRSRRVPAPELVSGATVAGVAYVTDFHVVPARLTPGFEHRLSPRGLFAVYAVLALTLGVATLAERRASHALA